MSISTGRQAEASPRTVELTAAAAALLDKIESRRARVAVMGLGYVGLPLAVAYAKAGYRVVGVDVDRRKVSSLNAGVSYVSDIASEDVAALAPRAGSARDGNGDRDDRQGSLRATTDYEALADVDAVIMCVPTPLSGTKDPDMSFVVSAADEVARRLKPGTLIVLESTTYPGTTEEVILPRLEGREASDGRGPLVVGRDFFLAFSPERIDPGREDWNVNNTPKVIGGVTPACLAVARALYSAAIDRVVPVSDPKTAEMVKLLENTFRAVNIGLINEVAIMCDRLGVDVWEVIEAAKTKPFGFVPFYPGPGLGGHCIPIDPQYLAWKLKTLDYHARFIQLAADINFSMPHYVVGKLADALNDRAKPVKGSRILLLGMAYKPDVGDLRESPSLDVMELLLDKGADVVFHDPYAPELKLNGVVHSTIELTEEELAKADCVVITTAHSTYDWEMVVTSSRLVFDTRNATRGVPANLEHLVKL